MKYTRINKGFTLIEVIVVLGIITLLLGSLLIGSRKATEYINNSEVESCKNNILALINNSKLYCRNKNTNGELVFDTTNNKITFNTGVRLMETLTLPKAFKLMNVKTHDGNNAIEIDKYGFTADACTISFADKANKKYYATICVGTSYFEIK